MDIMTKVYERTADAASRLRNARMSLPEYWEVRREFEVLHGRVIMREGGREYVTTLFGYPIITGAEGVILWRACEWCQTKEVPRDDRCVKCGAPVDGLGRGG